MRDFDFPYLVYKLIDKPLLGIVYSVVDIKLIEKSLKLERDYFCINKTDTGIDFLTTMLNAVHSRASAAIGHISIMMGVTVLLISRSNDIIFLRNLMLIEVAFYVFLLLLSLICVRSMTLNDGIVHTDFEKVYREALLNRFAVLQVINSCLVIATILFLLLVFLVAMNL